MSGYEPPRRMSGDHRPAGQPGCQPSVRPSGYEVVRLSGDHRPGRQISALSADPDGQAGPENAGEESPGDAGDD